MSMQSDSSSPPFSIVVITYNREALLPRALDSIFAQAGNDFEVVVVDDGSTDGTPALLKTYAERQGERMRVVRQEHMGSCAASRTAYQAACGTWMIFVDSDDRLRPGAMEALRQAARAHGEAAVVLAGVVTVDGAGRERPVPAARLGGDRMGNFRNFLIGRLRAVIAGGLIRREHLALFDSARHGKVHGADLAVLGAALVRGVAQIEAQTLDVIAHDGRLRDDVNSIHQSGLAVVEMLFDPEVLPAEAMALRHLFESFIEGERARAYHRAGWHS
jgi:glycosyltransferase involved in cell wall biosynthesis